MQRTSMHAQIRVASAVGALAMLTVACGRAAVDQPASNPVVFNAVAVLNATVGQPFSYSFCRPNLTASSDLCGGTATSPTGGQPPYHFQLGSGVGFPPVGTSIGLNGILSGTPSAAGTSTFSVCAVDVAGQSACRTVIMTVVGTIAVGQVAWACSISASPLPGWKNCTATVILKISKPIQSGYVSVYFNYPDDGGFFHGELAVNAGGVTQTVTVNLVSEYVSHCVTSYATTVDVYDGRQNAVLPPLLVSTPVTLTATCT